MVDLESIWATLTDIDSKRSPKSISGQPHTFLELTGARMVETTPFEPDPRTYRDDYYYNTVTNRLYRRITTSRTRDDADVHWAQLDQEYSEEIQQLAAEFNQIDKKNKEAINAWLRSHTYLKNHDLAKIIGVAQAIISQMLKRAGIHKHNGRKQPPYLNNKKKPPLIAPADWDTAWLIAKNKEGYGYPKLAKAVGRSRRTIWLRLRKKLRSPAEACKSTNPCCTIEWLLEHYVGKVLSTPACAKLANVAPSTIRSWLNKFKIRIRSSGEASALYHAANLAKQTGK